MGLLILLFVSALVHFATAETGDAYHGPPQARELFSYKDKMFYFYSDRVPYDEARAICEAGDMHLTNLDEPVKAKFAAQSIAEAWMVFEDMWVGAKKGDLGKWVWEWTNKRIPDDQFLATSASTNDNKNTFPFMSYMYPPWVDGETPARDGKDCLGVDRNGHNDPYFVDLDCKLPRPFICEQNLKQKKTDPWLSGVVNIFDIEFILYHGRVSWPGAVSFCQQQGFALATVENMSVARKLAKAMLKSRPEFEDAWIGANLKDGQWIWVENGEEIKNLPAEYKDPDRGNAPDNIITPQFPTWFETPIGSNATGEKACAIFDRHLCDEPKFIGLKCNRQRDFICIKKEEAKETNDVNVIIDRAKKRYIFFPVAATWDDAKQICEEESDATTMLNLEDSEETRFIMQAMSDARKPIDHLWLGGKVSAEDGKWHWIGRGDNEERGAIEMTPDEFGFPPWCDNETSLDMACLNLDRQNHWTPLIYGLECNSTQAVVCVQPVEPNDITILYDGSSHDDPPVTLRISKLSNSISWQEAQSSCSRDIGKLWRPRFDLNDSEGAIQKFFVAIQKTLTGPNTSVYHIDGGVYSAKEGEGWMHNGVRFQVKTIWEPHDGDCLVGQINATSTEWAWYPVKCYHKLYAQVICQPQCSLLEVPYETENSDWICDAASSEIFDHKMKNMGCSHHCKQDLVTYGPDRYFCKKDGWRSNQANVPVQASECKSPEDALTAFSTTPTGISTLGFIIDSTSDSPADYNATKFLIGNLIDYYRSKVNSLSVHIVSIESDPLSGSAETAKIMLKDFKVDPTDCKAIKDEIDKLTDTGLGMRDYLAGLSKMKEAMIDSTLSEANIVFIMPEANQRSNYKEVASNLNEDAKVYAIGTNKHTPINQLVDVASKINGESFAMQFGKPPDVFKAVKALMSKCESGKCHCTGTFDYLDRTSSEAPNEPPKEEKKPEEPKEPAKPEETPAPPAA